MIWTPATGMIYVTDFLNQNGVTDHRSWVSLTKVVCITPDGRLMIGEGVARGSGPGSANVLKRWIVTLK